MIAESDHTLVVEGNHYFPPGAVRLDYLRATAAHKIQGYIAFWRGVQVTV